MPPYYKLTKLSNIKATLPGANNHPSALTYNNVPVIGLRVGSFSRTTHISGSLNPRSEFYCT